MKLRHRCLSLGLLSLSLTVIGACNHEPQKSDSEKVSASLDPIVKRDLGRILSAVSQQTGHPTPVGQPVPTPQKSDAERVVDQLGGPASGTAEPSAAGNGGTGQPSGAGNGGTGDPSGAGNGGTSLAGDTPMTKAFCDLVSATFEHLLKCVGEFQLPVPKSPQPPQPSRGYPSSQTPEGDPSAFEMSDLSKLFDKEHQKLLCQQVVNTPELQAALALVPPEGVRKLQCVTEQIGQTSRIPSANELLPIAQRCGVPVQPIAQPAIPDFSDYPTPTR